MLWELMMYTTQLKQVCYSIDIPKGCTVIKILAPPESRDKAITIPPRIIPDYVRELDLSNLNLTELNPDMLPRSLTHLYLDRIPVKSVFPETSFILFVNKFEPQFTPPPYIDLFIRFNFSSMNTCSPIPYRSFMINNCTNKELIASNDLSTMTVFGMDITVFPLWNQLSLEESSRSLDQIIEDFQNEIMIRSLNGTFQCGFTFKTFVTGNHSLDELRKIILSHLTPYMILHLQRFDENRIEIEIVIYPE